MTDPQIYCVTTYFDDNKGRLHFAADHELDELLNDDGLQFLDNFLVGFRRLFRLLVQAVNEVRGQNQKLRAVLDPGPGENLEQGFFGLGIDLPHLMKAIGSRLNNALLFTPQDDVD